MLLNAVITQLLQNIITRFLTIKVIFNQFPDLEKKALTLKFHSNLSCSF